MTYITNHFAAAYGQGTYNAEEYQSNASTTPTTPTTPANPTAPVNTEGTSASTGTAANPSTGGSTLTNTGVEILIAATVACVIIFTALMVRFWKRPNSTPIN